MLSYSEDLRESFLDGVLADLLKRTAKIRLIFSSYYRCL